MFPPTHLSKNFMEFVKSIGESHSKYQEDQIISHEIHALKKVFQDPQLLDTNIKEYLVRALYAKMLGHNPSFAYIHAVKLTQSKNLLHKKLGYLFCSLCLDKDHELLLLLINTIQKDLQSSNYMEVDMALSCICKLLNTEMIMVVYPAVLNLSKHHSKETIRKKGCMALRAIYSLQPHLLDDTMPNFIRAALADTNISVISAALHLLSDLLHTKKHDYVHLIPSLVAILKQICERRYPRDYEYHLISAPWIQIKLLSLLGILAQHHDKGSQEVHEILLSILHKTDLRSNVSFAILYEAIKTVTKIFASPTLLKAASNVVTKFITSENANLKYAGLTALASLVRFHPSLAAKPEHQRVVMEALEASDEALQRKTLDLLCSIANSSNAVAIVEKLLTYLKNFIHVEFSTSLVSKICRLMDRFSTDHVWYITTLNKLLLVASNVIPKALPPNLLRLVAEGPTGNETQDTLFREQVANIYITLLQKHSTVLPDPLLKIAVWIIGEYGSFNSLEGFDTLESLILLLCRYIKTNYLSDSAISCLLSAIFKLSVTRLISLVFNPVTMDDLNEEEDRVDVQDILWPPRPIRLVDSVFELLQTYSQSSYSIIMQQCAEFTHLVLDPEPGQPLIILAVLREVYPLDGACEDIEMDEHLTFLNDFVHSAVKQGALPYKRPEERKVPRLTASFSSPPSHSSLVLDRTKALPTEAPLPSADPSMSNSLTSTMNVPGSSNFPLPRIKALEPNTMNLSTTRKVLTHDETPYGPESSGQSPITQHSLCLTVSGPRVWGPSGYEAHHFSTHYDSQVLTSRPVNTKDAKSIHQRDPSRRFTASQRNISLNDEQRKMASQLFSGLTPDQPSLKETDSNHSTSLEKKKELFIQQLQPTSSLSCESDQPVSSPRLGSSPRPDLLDLVSEGEKKKSSTPHPLVHSPRNSKSTTNGTEIIKTLLNTCEHSSSKSSSLLLQHESENIPNSIEPTTCSTWFEIHPFQTTLEQVEKDWTRLLHEARLSIPTSLVDSSILFETLEGLLSLAMIQTIGHEAIFSGTAKLVSGQATPSPIYLHTQLTAKTRINFFFKGNNQQELTFLLKKCTDYFTET